MLMMVHQCGIQHIHQYLAFNRTTPAYSHLVDTLSSDIESSRTRNSRSLYGFINHSSNIDSTISTYAM
ncbi:unnamed protein product [Rotaria socialis]|uniref:Uncharacterized protein n=1 Tax=Rotaria socialis TaxID=392032 RepID=A0A817QJF8_9BILA|nr:unnamed protein product [Rotaria socialis]